MRVIKKLMLSASLALSVLGLTASLPTYAQSTCDALG